MEMNRLPGGECLPATFTSGSLLVFCVVRCLVVSFFCKGGGVSTYIHIYIYIYMVEVSKVPMVMVKLSTGLLTYAGAVVPWRL